MKGVDEVFLDLNVGANSGTFSGSTGEPIHRWFKYPAGFSPQLVRALLRDLNIEPGALVLDPFVGVGTTSIVCRLAGIDSVGVEAHRYIHEVALAKLDWPLEERELNQIQFLLDKIRKHVTYASHPVNSQPKLLQDSFEVADLVELLNLRDLIKSSVCTDRVKRLGLLALSSALRPLSTAETGWSYILPKRKKKPRKRDVIGTVSRFLYNIASDVIGLSSLEVDLGRFTLSCSDARSLERVDGLNTDSVDFTITSPPYLNNYDYADRTRLEMYFFGLAASWSEISSIVRQRLIPSATTQVHRSESYVKAIEGLRQFSAFPEIDRLRETLAAVRRRPNGKLGKNYDVLVTEYFWNMVHVLRELRRVHKPGAPVIMVLGDSAPYGVYVDTPNLMGRLALDCGFTRYECLELRERGNRWSSNGRRHKVQLWEKILLIR